VNTGGDEYEPLPSPDGRSMIVQAGDAYFETRRSSEGWTPRVRLGPEVNATGTEIGAAVSPSGRSLLFARDVSDGRSGELFLWRRGGAEPWPPVCGRADPSH
jgi:hypothetical protein